MSFLKKKKQKYKEKPKKEKEKNQQKKMFIVSAVLELVLSILTADVCKY